MGLRRAPSLGAIALLVILVVALVSGGDDDEPRGGGDGASVERGEGGEGAGAGSPGRDDGARGGPPTGAVRAEVLDVTDGDTIRVLIRGEEESVRYIGIDTPESVAPGEPVECFGARASEFNDRLVGGERVRLSFDAERRDV